MKNTNKFLRKIQPSGGIRSLSILAGLLVLAGVGPVLAAPVCGDGGVTVLAFRTQAAHAPTADAAPTMLSLKIDRPSRPDLADKLALYQIGCKAMTPLLSALHHDAAPQVVGVYRKLGSEVHADAPATTGAGMRTFELIVLSDATPGHDADYNKWYDTEHVHDVLIVPGFETAQRFVLISNQTPKSYRLPRYAIRFVFQSADLQATAADIKHRLVTGVTRGSPYYEMATSVTRYYAEN
jgi:hypothetical protein